MTRKERIFACVTDEGVTANMVAEAVKMDHRKARAFLWELAQEGRIARAVGAASVAYYFLTEEAARRFDSGDAKRDQVLAAITESGWTVRKLLSVVGMRRTSIEPIVAELEKEGKIYSATFRNATTYFPTKEAAEAFKHGFKPSSALPPTVEVKATTKRFIEGAQIVIPPHVQKQECPPFKGLGFAEPVSTSGDFSRIGIGRYLPAEDRRLARKAA